MSKPRRDERRSAREVKRMHLEQFIRPPYMAAEPAEILPTDWLLVASGNQANKPPEPLHVNAMSKENEGN